MTGSSHDSDVSVEASVFFSTVILVLIVVYRSSSRERGVPSRQAPRLAPEKHEADQGTGGNPSRVSK
jgi:hypothetical protein